MPISRLTRSAATGLILTAGLSGPAISQDAQPSWDYFFRSEARFDDNAGLDDVSPGDSYFLINTLGLGNRVQTSVSDFRLNVSGHVRLTDTPIDDDTVVFDDPLIELGYERVVGDDRLNFFLSAQKVDVAFLDALAGDAPDAAFENPLLLADPTVENIDLIDGLDFDDVRGDGSREQFDARLNGVINGDAPLSFAYRFLAVERRFVDDTEAEDLDDFTRFAADASVLFDITRTVRGVVDLRYDYLDEEDSVETLRRRASVSTGLDMQLDGATTLRFRIGASEVRTEERVFDTEDTETGAVGSFDLIRALQDGSVNLSFNAQLDENGQRETLTVGRIFDRGDTEFGGDIGVTSREFTDEVRPTGALFITQELPRARLSANLRQSFGVGSESADTVATRLGLNYEQDFTNDLSFILSIAAARRFETEDEDNETRRLNVTASLRTPLTQNWDFDVGYRFRYRDGGEDDETATSNAVFAALVRDLQID